MSPELESAPRDDVTRMALKRIYNFKRLRELNAPPVLIEQASGLLEKSKHQLGKQYNAVRDLFDEFRPIHEAQLAAENQMMMEKHDDDL